MNKRQIKKRNKKRIPVIADEYNWLTMTAEELEKAYKDYDTFVEKYTYRKRYKDLKGKFLVYYYPMGKQSVDFLREAFSICRKRSIDTNKINNNPGIITSSEEALKDVIPFNWSEDVLSGKKKLTISQNNI